MRRTEARQSDGSVKHIVALGLGALLALGIELIVLLLGSVAVSAGVLRANTEMQVTAAACLIGCVAGGCFACSCWGSRRLLCGLLTGLLCFVFIFFVALISADEFKFGSQGLIEIAGCLIGGGLAGMAGAGKKKKRRKNWQR